ncbi:SDR family oxidoreductase [Herbiconiux sp. VKM Ac-2851]|uniref:SDR family oxidoreductase n=1 Tax=Herbiconiux sp. VKM Ac-2851 TaxID=2739025 RepID=UPI00156449F4|nr:SDR family oxidoreductase [Herbiconiux sp. VKM Ac-2851]NQX37114.1 SDR family oxidoreductase [Herbiconiux sp. VKM Ac-2851]
MDLGLKNRLVVVGGGSKGMGRAAARRFSLEGARVVIVARTPETLAEAATEITAESSVPVGTFVTDLTAEAGRAALLSAYPAADVLVTNAGVPQRPVNYQDMTRTEWIAWFDAHFFSAIDLIQAYAPGMAERRFGRIVNVSASFIKFPQTNVPSHAARLALAGAIASTVRDVAPYNVTINSVLPGLINTGALREALQDSATKRGVTYETVEKEVLSGTAAGRLAEPHEVGDLIAMLCSTQLGYVTGQNIVIDGGTYTGLF